MQFPTGPLGHSVTPYMARALPARGQVQIITVNSINHPKANQCMRLRIFNNISGSVNPAVNVIVLQNTIVLHIFLLVTSDWTALTVSAVACFNYYYWRSRSTSTRTKISTTRSGTEINLSDERTSKIADDSNAMILWNYVYTMLASGTYQQWFEKLNRT